MHGQHMTNDARQHLSSPNNITFKTCQKERHEVRDNWGHCYVRYTNFGFAQGFDVT